MTVDAGAAVCPLCRKPVPAADLDAHVRAVHNLHTYRGVRRTLADTLDAARDDLLGGHPADAIGMLASLAPKGDAEKAAFLAAKLAEALNLWPADDLPSALDALAPHVPLDYALVESLGDGDGVSKRLALAVLAGSVARFDKTGYRLFRRSLLDAGLPEEVRLDAVVAAWPSLTAIDLAEPFLRKVLPFLSKGRALTWLKTLARRLGEQPAVSALLPEYEDRARVACPRCDNELRRSEIESHLWHAHRLLLEGTKVRDPWTALEAFLESDRRFGRAELIGMARTAAAKIDAAGGRPRLARVMLRQRLGDREDRALVTDGLAQKNETCCPACYVPVPLPREEPVPVFQVRGRTVQGAGYRVMIDDRGLRPRLVVDTPSGPFLDMREPEHAWTPRGLAFLATLLPAAAALLCGFFWPESLGAPLRPVAALVFVGAIVYALTDFLTRRGMDLRERLLTHAWSSIIDRIPGEGYTVADSGLVAGMARLCSRQRWTKVPAELLTEWIRRTTLAVELGQGPPGHLAALVRLQVERAADLGEDPVPLVVRWLGRCFEGRLPIAFGQHLLDDWPAPCWTAANLARLRVLLCDRAFEAGFEVRGLISACTTAPALGVLLEVGKPRSLSALRLLWSLRATKPWDKLGNARTAFEVAAAPEAAHAFEERPDLLLHLEDTSTPITVQVRDEPPGPTAVSLTLSGVWLHGILYMTPPRVVEVRMTDVGGELVMGQAVFRSPRDLEGLSRTMEKWFRYAFHEFLPTVDRVEDWRPPDRSKMLKVWGAVKCGECGATLLPRVGEIGVGVDGK